VNQATRERVFVLACFLCSVFGFLSIGYGLQLLARNQKILIANQLVLVCMIQAHAPQDEMFARCPKPQEDFVP
jgi:accessory gene regulator protein AgrB